MSKNSVFENNKKGLLLGNLIIDKLVEDGLISLDISGMIKDDFKTEVISRAGETVEKSCDVA